MSLHAKTPNGSKDLFLRGWLGPRGLKGFTQVRVTTPSGDKQVWDHSGAISGGGGMTVTVDPLNVSGALAIHSAGLLAVPTSAATVTATGGAEPYTYAWSLVSDDGAGGTWSAIAPTSATTPFLASAVAPGTGSSAIFSCTVTDARGATASVTVGATADNFSY